ncbi:hypothetical protein EW146_g6622 [Bondarzewia mesenterica]|uniref:DNA mismatch repair protein S5 domain-containing protein n=1 Tax=Bondarzewia mesenterica TaxID=1095465 RepID=A0A4S4LTP2_9AGAM|nr:hypothetical protein EW146_g6622 [Bondarzewia mesenterica]
MSTRLDSPEPEPQEPKPIRRLQESLINRIAAGEIIHRPSSALKELLENCLDAGTTSIRITIKDGGMKLLQIQDNGCGIKKSDLPILAQRFTTSKLSSFSDLSRLTTYGFRGEALASISHVANLTVITKTKKDACAWRACYIDGELTPSKPGLSPEPKPFAGNDGTTITVENLFYNTPARLSALRSSAEEYARILDVVTKYAVHNSGVSFVCKKAGSATPDLSTPSSSTTHQAIRLLYGQSLARELLHIQVSPSSRKKHDNKGKGKGKRKHSEIDESDADEDEEAQTQCEEDWKAEVHFTSANHHAKKMVFLLFINHRLVESSRIKRAIESVYSGILPKGSSPFVYLSLQLDPTTVDVNVHPTKREVHFLDEEAIIEHVADEMQTKLAGIGERTFEYQTLLTGGIAEPDGGSKTKMKERARQTEEDDRDDGQASTTAATTSNKKKVLSQHKVRTSVADRTLDSMFPVASQSPIPCADGDASPTIAQVREKERVVKESVCYLDSIKRLRKNVIDQTHERVVDLERELSLVQYSTKLYLVSHGALAEELFYQLGLRQFGDLQRFKLNPPPSLRALVTLAVEAEEGTEQSKLTKPQIVDAIMDILVSRRDMLAEYFSFCISADGLVESLPLLFQDYTPNLDKLPLFLMRLGPQVNWTSEVECFDTFLRELAYFYIPGPLSPHVTEEAGSGIEKGAESQPEKAEKWQIQHVLFQAMRRYLLAPRSLLDRDVVQVASLPDLYRVFERC